MAKTKGNVVLAAKKIFASIDEHRQYLYVVKNALVIEFKNSEDFEKAIQSGSIEFTIFSSDQN